MRDDARVDTNQADRRRTRRSSGQARKEVLAAAYDELREVGFRQLTIEGVARRSGVAKTTIYRWWTSKATLLLDAVNSSGDRYPDFRETGDARSEVVTELRDVIAYFASDHGRAFLELVAEAAFDDALAEALSDQFVAARRAATTEVLRRGIANGQVRADVDVDTVMDTIWGAVYYRLLVLHDRPGPELADRILATVWPAMEAREGDRG